MNIRFSFFFFIFLAAVFLGNPSHGQTQIKKSRAQLEREKADVQKRLLEFDQILKQTSARKKNTLGELRAVSSLLATRIAYINTLNREVNLIEKEISDT